MPFEGFLQAFLSRWVTFSLCGVVSYCTYRCIYNLYFHPNAKYPGPFLAAVSNVWYGYHWITGKYPMAIRKALEQYGDVVRIAPNELVFIKPQAASDIFGTQTQGLELFPKADFISLGWSDQGLSWEKDPIWHRTKAKKVRTAFSPRSLRRKESITHRYVDRFITIMKEIGNQSKGIELRDWADWLAMDIAADLAYSHKMGLMEKKESSAHLRALWEANFFVTVHTTSKKFPLLGWLQYFTVPPSTIAHYMTALKENKAAFTERLENRDSSQHMDHFHELLPPDGAPITKKELDGLEMSCQHLVIAGFEPISTNFLCCIAFSLQDKECYRRLVEEIRGSFARYEDMTADSLLSLKYLHATIMEELRMAVIASSGLPRVSPGATIDGHYIQKGVEVQYGNYAFTRSNRYFHDAFNFHPERWLPQDHPYYDPVYANDALDDFHPWGLGVRGCPGKSLAIQQARIILAKVLWTFDAERLPGQSMNFERDFKMYGMLEKPQYWVRLLER